MKTIYSLGLLLFLFTGCSKYEFWETSKFHMDSTALADNEEVKLLYLSRGPGDNAEREYYYQLIVISQKTGDTVNVLTTADNGITAEDQDKIFNYFDIHNPVTKISQINLDNLENLSATDITDLKLKKIDKVARDPEFDYLADNHYPTVIGSIGAFSKAEGQ
ncbi:MAG: hypothetical protein JWM14_533 [Chitinophagaceae bacterium]|nr:hypothetical protein [Chitinophagaceae bacterium]